MKRVRIRMSRLLLPSGIAVAIALVSLLHLRTVDAHPLLHELTQRLYYLPIVYAAWRYGFRSEEQLLLRVRRRPRHGPSSLYGDLEIIGSCWIGDPPIGSTKNELEEACWLGGVNL